ncbi:hypothetical protein [Saccharopolyspora sp. NPDC002686]|uniref:hypothetical protein n=1 Tax=Saccharopolyspora sp. NPDC002686 TaxID=3154541 RepID=UPI00331CFE2A
MTVIDHGIVAHDQSAFLTDSLDRVFFHMGSTLDNDQADKISDHLAAGDNVRAAQALAAIAAAAQRLLPHDDRLALRTIIEAYNGDLTHIRALDAQANAEVAPPRSNAVRFLRTA